MALTNNSYPHIPDDQETVRPYRLYNAKTKKLIPYRHYKYPINGHKAAVLECGWAPIGTVIELIDYSKGALLGVFRRRVDGVGMLNIKRMNDHD